MSTHRRAIVHIGTHKTGTTSFQELLRARHTAGKFPVDVRPHTGFWIPSHVELAVLTVREELITSDRMLYPDSALPAVREQLYAHIRKTVESEAPTVVFSCEGLSYIRTEAEVLRLVELMAPRSVEVVCAFRDPAEFLAAYRDTILRFDGLRNLSTQQGAVGYVEPDSWLVDYDAIRRTWHEGAGIAALTEIDYDAAVNQDGTILRALADAAGLDFDPSTEGDRRENRRSDLPASRLDLEQDVGRLEAELIALTSAHAMELEHERNRGQLERAHREEAERALRDVLESPSWRLTEPLRRLKHLVRRGAV